MTKSSANILIVDDDVDFLLWAKCVLEGAGYGVRTCADPTEALARLEENLPDLVITDLMMSALDSGFTLARSIKDMTCAKHLPVILVTAAAAQRGFDFRPHTDEDLAAMNTDAFLSKPLDPQQLLGEVHRLLASQDASPQGHGTPTKPRENAE